MLVAVASCQTGANDPRAEAASSSVAPSGTAEPQSAAVGASSGLASDPGDGGRELVLAARTFAAMGGVPVRLRGWATDRSALDRALPRAELLVEALEATFSTHRADSELARLNAAGSPPTPRTDGHLLALIGDALRLATLTDGAFDPTVGPLVTLWRTAARERRWPDRSAISAARSRVGTGRVRLDSRTGTVRLEPGTSIDLNAIAEGYMIDRVVDLLRAEGVERAYVEVGGDLRVYDDAQRRRPFRIGIRRPGGDDLVGTLELEDGALGTAGCYERFFVLGGERLCHVIDPRSGEPVRGIEGATVLAPTATAADALATAVLVLGPDWALGQWSRSEELGAVIVTRGPDGAQRTYVTAAMGTRPRADTPISLP